MKSDEEPVRFAAGAKAPQGGIIIRGIAYKGGEFVPKTAVEHATPEQRQSLGVSAEQGSTDSTPSHTFDNVTTKSRKLSELAQSVPKPLYHRAKRAVLTSWSRYQKRYGRKWTVSILAAGLSGLTVPLPVTAPVLLAGVAAIASLHLRLTKSEQPVQKSYIPLSATDIENLGREFMIQTLLAVGVLPHQLPLIGLGNLQIPGTIIHR